MGILITVASSIVIFIFCEGVVRIMFFNPYFEYKKLKSKTAYTLTYYANIYSNPQYFGEGVKISEDYKQASMELRKMAAELRAFIELKPRLSFGIPKKEIIYEVTKDLIFLSNNLHTAYNIKDAGRSAEFNEDSCNNIYRLLKIYSN
jgi:hypothetical protein